MDEREVQVESGDSLEVPNVARHQVQPVVDRRGGDLEVGVRKEKPLLLEFSSKLPENPRRRDVEGEDGDRGEHAFFNVLEMALPSRRPEGTLEQLAYAHRTGELVFPGDRSHPLQIGRVRFGPEEFRDRVCVEEQRHDKSVRGGSRAAAPPLRLLEDGNQFLGVVPPAGDARESSLRAPSPESAKGLQVFPRSTDRICSESVALTSATDRDLVDKGHLLDNGHYDYSDHYGVGQAEGPWTVTVRGRRTGWPTRPSPGPARR